MVYADRYNGESIMLTPYVRNTSTKQDVLLGGMMIKDEDWKEITFTIPTLDGAMVDEIGLLLKANSPAKCKDFKIGVIVTGNFARDADTIGAVAGAIRGAKYGIDGTPEHWVEKTQYLSGICLNFTKGLDIIHIGEQLAELI